ncbi:MAG: L,D-transpeptidase [Promicromonosporaceae bacterium]|nr:L,D-transpeptidase [Promicromonosporaceae bacterium]
MPSRGPLRFLRRLTPAVAALATALAVTGCGEDGMALVPLVEMAVAVEIPSTLYDDVFELPQFDDWVAPQGLTEVLAHLGITEADLLELPRPAKNRFLPEGLGTAGPDDLLPFAAVPKYDLIPASSEPNVAPTLALEKYTNTVIEPITARWTVVGQEPGWVRVMVPAGRGSLPSVDPNDVNHHAVWVPESTVALEEEPYQVVVRLSERLLNVYYNDVEQASFHVGIGVEGSADTPTGVCTVIGRVLNQLHDATLLTSCQSERLDGFAGAPWSTIAIHEGGGFSLSRGGAVSHGCIRVAPAHFKAYLDEIPIGAAVVILP